VRVEVDEVDPIVRNLLDRETGVGETFEPLAGGAAFRLERIVSRGAASPPGFWYDQEEPEWVALLAGTATLELQGGKPVELSAGEALLLPAHRRHRVAATSPDAVWLALHFAFDPTESGVT